MILAVDAHYSDKSARVAGVLFREWDAEQADREIVLNTDEPPAEYEPGEFYKRELPLIMAVLDKIERPDCIVVDGYVYLDAAGRKGLGAHVFEVLGGDVAIIGVAKTAFQGSAHAAAVCRGSSARPLYVTAVGLERDVAADHVQQMHGAHRIPTLLKEVDRLCRKDTA